MNTINLYKLLKKLKFFLFAFNVKAAVLLDRTSCLILIQFNSINFSFKLIQFYYGRLYNKITFALLYHIINYATAMEYWISNKNQIKIISSITVYAFYNILFLSCCCSHATEANPRTRVVTADPKSFQYGKVELSDKRARPLHALGEH